MDMIDPILQLRKPGHKKVKEGQVHLHELGHELWEERGQVRRQGFVYNSCPIRVCRMK